MTTVLSSSPHTPRYQNRQTQLAAATALSLLFILLLGGWLRFYHLGENGLGNTYYATTVKSMLTSWHNFFFASYEPGGSVTVDKPPLGFWVQAIFAYLLGINGFALALPQALAGWLSIPLLYHLVQRHLGRVAGLVAAFVLAITPVTISTERNNTIDGQLLFVLLLAAWAFILATEKGKLRYLWLGVFLVGVGFNIKMMQAFLPLPAFYALYWLGGAERQRLSDTVTGWRDWLKGLVKRGFHLAAATLLLLTVSLSWALIVDLTPAENRPYIGSTRENRVMELILGHNGLARLMPGGNFFATLLFNDEPAMPPAGGQPGQPPVGNNGPSGNQLPGPALPGNQQPGNGVPGNFTPGAGNNPPPGGPGRPGGMSQEIGAPGPLRLFTAPLVTEASWLLPLALWGGVCLGLVLRPRFPLPLPALSLILWGGWLVTEIIFFSFANLFHAYYLIMLGPPLAALIGGLVWVIRRLYAQHPWRAWGMLLVGVVLTLILQLSAWFGYAATGRGLVAGTIIVVLIGLIGLLALTLWQARPRWAMLLPLLLILGGLNLSPLVWSSLTTTNDNPNVMLPRAGLVADNGGQARPRDNNQATNTQTNPGYAISPAQQAILSYIQSHPANTPYLLAANSSNEASPFILATGAPVLTMGGFNGGDPVVTVEALADMVAAGELKYIADGGSLRQQKQEIYTWLNDHCTNIPLPETVDSNIVNSNNLPAGQRDQQSWELFACGN